MTDDSKSAIPSSVFRSPSSVFRCPRCHKGKLYKGLLAVAERCGECGLPFGGHEEGDGPAFFGILIVGALAGIFVAIVEVKYAPPFWLHAAIWIPFVLIGSVMALKLGKAALIHAQYRVRQGDFT